MKWFDLFGKKWVLKSQLVTSFNNCLQSSFFLALLSPPPVNHIVCGEPWAQLLFPSRNPQNWLCSKPADSIFSQVFLAIQLWSDLEKSQVFHLYFEDLSVFLGVWNAAPLLSKEGQKLFVKSKTYWRLLKVAIDSHMANIILWDSHLLFNIKTLLSLWGKKGLVYLQTSMISVDIGFWQWGLDMYSGEGGSEKNPAIVLSVWVKNTRILNEE